MDLFRKGFERFYELIKPAVFSLTANDPEKAHELFISGCKTLYALGLEKLVLDTPENHLDSNFEISNAAGFNKNGEYKPVLRTGQAHHYKKANVLFG